MSLLGTGDGEESIQLIGFYSLVMTLGGYGWHILIKPMCFSKAPSMVGLLGGSVASGLAKEVDPFHFSPYPGSGVLTHPFITSILSSW